MWMTVKEQERRLGEQIRARRLKSELTTKELAAYAELSPRTVQNLEHGRGSTVATLVRVLRALNAEDWLESLTPEEPVSPIQMLEAERVKRRPRQRAGRKNG